MLDVVIDSEMIRFGERMGISFHRTLRLPEDDRSYPLPPGLGRFPLYRVSAYAKRLPQAITDTGGAFIPMYQCEALWIGFNGARWKPNAVVIAVGGINALSGEPDDGMLHAGPQNYIVAPPQPWLDGINSGRETIRQFIALPLGLGGTIEAAISGKETYGGMQITVYEPKAGLFPDTPPPVQASSLGDSGPARPMHAPAAPMGLGAGGRMKQKIYRDPYGVGTWDRNNCGSLALHIVNSLQFQRITGEFPPPTPVDAGLYAELGLPWFELYDESLESIAPSEQFSRIYGDDRPPSADSSDEEKTNPISDSRIQTIGQRACAASRTERAATAAQEHVQNGKPKGGVS